ncbi:MAG TPA: heme NO-binding domain-containing protein [Candidatus Nitrosotenuis sp.]|nr:heme NO-binding domain-containing protein [Candidatus Nitrosotenuis sp.]
MKGVLFNLLEEVVTREHGEAAWDAILEAAGLEGAYTSLGSYPDEDLPALATAASHLLGTDPDEILRWFGRQAIPLLARAYPQVFAPHRSTRSFLLTLNDVIHPEVRKLYPGADVPFFEFHTPGEQVLEVGYSSPRRLCALAEGLMEGAARHFGEGLQIDQPRCMRRGDPKCLLVCRFSASGGRGGERDSGERAMP